MPSGQGFGLALLVALFVLAASQAQQNPPACNYTRMRALEIPISKTAGTWYRKLENYGLPGDENMLGYRAVITDRSDSEGQKMQTVVSKEFPNKCETVAALCTVKKGESHCVIDPNSNSTVSDYQGRIFAISSEFDIVVFEAIVNLNNGTSFTFFDVFTRDPLKKVTYLDLWKLRVSLVPGCGKKALNPKSDFYRRTFTYNRKSTCIVI